MPQNPLGGAGYFLLLIGLAYLLTPFVSKLLPHQWPSNEDSSGAARLVHVPKTGGAAIVNHLRSHRACPAMDGGGHEATEATALAHGQMPLIVLRDPLARLHSAFEYWQRGSEVHKRRPMAQLNQMYTALQAALPDFAAFVDGLTNSSSPRRPDVQRVVHTPHVLSDWVWDAHFKPQSHWAERESAKSVFVCYTPALGPRLQCIADESPTLRGCNFSSMRVVNRTPRRPTDALKPTPAQQLSEAQRAAVRAHFARDYALHERYCGRCRRECACCHASGRGETRVARCSSSRSSPPSSKKGGALVG